MISWPDTSPREQTRKGVSWRERLLALLVIGFVTCPAFSSRAQPQPDLVHHRFRFFLHPDLVSGLEEAELQSRLSRYVEDLNTIFAKNTVRRFDFDPAADLEITDTPPPIGYYPGELPETNYEVWAVVSPAGSTPYPFSHGGYMAFATNGAGVAAGLYWEAVHDRAALTNALPEDSALWNYWRQVHNMAHELGHVFGAAVGEYYSLRNVPDSTMTSPLHNLYYTDYGPTLDPYWALHPDYWSDPMMGWTPQLSWAELIGGVRFAGVTAAMINAGYRRTFPLTRYMPDLSATKIEVFNSSSPAPLPQVPVKVWKVMAHSPFSTELLLDARTGPDGVAQFAWGGEPDNEDNLLLVKAWPDNGPGLVRWFSFYDAEEHRMVLGRTNLLIALRPARTTSPALGIQAAGNSLRLAWPANAGGYILESALDLAASNFQAIQQTPASDGDLQYVDLTNYVPRSFFRLRLAP